MVNVHDILSRLPRSITVQPTSAGGHLQGIAIDAEREYIYLSFTTGLVKTDFTGRIVASVTGLVGHLGCIAYNYEDGRVYGSLEFKIDIIGRGIMKNIGYKKEVQDGFYIVKTANSTFKIYNEDGVSIGTVGSSNGDPVAA